MNKPDFQKQEAIRSLWDQDGEHVKKRWRNKGKGRSKDKRLVGDAMKEFFEMASIDQELEWDKEADEALYCYHYGPCAKCLKSKERD